MAMTDYAPVAQYQATQNLQLALWAERECVRLELLMDYSLPFEHPERTGHAATRWSVLSDQFGNGVSAPDGVTFIRAILIAFLYARILSIDSNNRAELFRRMSDALSICVASGDWSSLKLRPWYLSSPTIAGSFREVVWPWTFGTWSEIQSQGSGMVKLGAISKSARKVYAATLLSGPTTPFAPQGWWLQLDLPDAEFARVMLPASILIAITDLLNQVEDESGQMLLELLRRINLYYESPARISLGADAMAVRAAIRSALGQGDIADYRREDDATLDADRRMAAAVAAPPAPMDLAEQALTKAVDSVVNFFRRKR